MDNVNKPRHYTKAGIECIEAIRASMTDEQFLGYCKGNVMKYIWRFENKNGAEDLKKAGVYLKWMTETQEKIEKEEIRAIAEAKAFYEKQREKVENVFYAGEYKPVTETAIR